MNTSDEYSALDELNSTSGGDAVNGDASNIDEFIGLGFRHTGI
jgi:hypothetical protein